MTTPAKAAQPTRVTAGSLLRQWRALRGKSQLDLALDTGISQRHISFVESGRSRPSSRLVLELAEVLEVPLRERNTILLAAGYAPHYSDAGLDAPAFARLTGALKLMLRQHDPFPAVVMDRYWNVVLANEAAPRFFGSFTDLTTRPTPRNLLHLMFDPTGLRPFLSDWPATARMLLARVRREAVGHAIDQTTQQLLDALGRYPDVDMHHPTSEPEEATPLIPLSFCKDGITLSYFSLITTVGTPQAVAAQELRLECMIPADETTEREHRRLMARLTEAP